MNISNKEFFMFLNRLNAGIDKNRPHLALLWSGVIQI